MSWKKSYEDYFRIKLNLLFTQCSRAVSALPNGNIWHWRVSQRCFKGFWQFPKVFELFQAQNSSNIKLILCVIPIPRWGNSSFTALLRKVMSCDKFEMQRNVIKICIQWRLNLIFICQNHRPKTDRTAQPEQSHVQGVKKNRSHFRID